MKSPVPWILSLVVSVCLGCSESPGNRSQDAGSQDLAHDGQVSDLQVADLQDDDAPWQTQVLGCSPANCDGCCVGTSCARGFKQTLCGTGGQPCAPCAEPLSCVGGVCEEGPLEICNDVDDDGDGAEDEGCDDDNDSYCDESMTVEGAPVACHLGGGDCDDSLESVHPGATEKCNDRDDDCDDGKDEGSVCEGQDPAVASRPVHLPTVVGNLSCVEVSSLLYCFGGHRSPTPMDQIISFDPATDKLTEMQTKLPTPRHGLSCVASTAPAGGVYCFGGYWQEDRCLQYEPWGCVSATTVVHYFADVLRYDPGTDQLTKMQSTFPSGRTDLSCAEDSSTHKIYCFGGAENGPTALDTIVEYDPAQDSISVKQAKLPVAREGLSCAENSESHRIYCFGGKQIQIGHTGAGSIDSIVAYDPATDELTELSIKLPSARVFLSCVEKSDTHRIYCAGGVGADGARMVPHDEILEFDEAGPTIQPLSSTFASPRYWLSCAEHRTSHSLFCFGGGANVVDLDEVVQIQP